ncbi:RagB/SusD family nutrient uptake outer membrane protein [Robertkochia solimangrovi]|uniref:RagB/SusD family nutrient uptake outer membrane protein n=1 Tax=Robertkochia solimangrovi TaxID=2213046 RepID=UPI001180A4A9|nr:RagB/SusD family nutrient uptake outer membrane protein [Robertkochia solimangrovi]TRZ41286.1 RagB/SusD family nutrient uptake outer membrane protein [Robertkochia solimangrovi]
MIRNIRIPFISFITLLCVTSCSNDFLDIDPEQNVAAENAITDLKTLQTAMNGVYSTLQNNDYYGRSMYVIPELMADNLYLSSRNTGRYLDYNNFVVSDEDAYAEGTWNALYVVVANANRAIAGGESLTAISDTQQNQIDQLVGEAYAIRALAHFDLVRLFAQPFNYTDDASHPGIPVISTVNEDEIRPARNSVAEVYQQIVGDLQLAISYMSTNTADGRFSMSAAKALAARVALYKEDYAMAISYATEVIDGGNFDLIGYEDYAAIWASEYNEESIFEIVNTIADNAGTNGLGHYFDPDGYADALATTDLFDSYASGDIRLSTLVPGSKTGAEEEALFVGKFPQGTSHDDNVRILRLAEQYLIRAEAYAKTDQEQEARADVNTIIQRALPGTAEVTETGEALLIRILDERRKEFAFEGQRLFDLNRNKMDVEIVQGENVIHAIYPNEKFILPIPLSEMNANPNMEQNPGY